jgi:hypothetical protein
MNRTHHALALVLLIPLSLSFAGAAPRAEVLDKQFFWYTSGLTLDTLGWDSVEQRAGVEPTGATCPRDAAGELRARGKAIMRVEEPSAMSVAVLGDLGFSVVVLSQWTSLPSGELRRKGAHGSIQYGDARLISDYHWEALEKVDIEKPTRMREDFLLTLHFRKGACSEYEGREGLEKSAKHIPVGSRGTSVDYDEGGGSTDLKPLRRIHATYIITDAGSKPSTVIEEMEKVMDKLKLDLSYKIPKLVAVPAGRSPGKKGRR